MKTKFINSIGKLQRESKIRNHPQKIRKRKHQIININIIFTPFFIFVWDVP